MLSDYQRGSIFGAVIVACAFGFALYKTGETPGPTLNMALHTQAIVEGHNQGTFWQRVADNPTDSFTLCLVLIAVVQAVLFYVQLGYMQDGVRQSIRASDAAAHAANASTLQAELARASLIASNRAWVEGRLVLKNQPLNFLNGGVSTSVSFELKNSGQSPALNVSVHAWLLGRHPHSQTTALEQHIARCVEVKKKHFERTFMMFPGQTFPMSAGYPSYSHGIALKPEALVAGTYRNQDHSYIDLFIGGCVNYTFATDDDTIHQTSFLYRLHRKTPPFAIIIEQGSIPGDELSFGDIPEGDGLYAD